MYGDVEGTPRGGNDIDILADKEERQKRHYFLLSELQNMARELPGKYQQRLPYDLLSSLSNALLDGTVFEIVRSLKEVQQLEERNLFNQRVKLMNEMKAEKQNLKMQQKEALQKCQNKPHQLPYVKNEWEAKIMAVEKKKEDEMKKKDMKIILEMDQKVMDQQVTLQRAGVPGFSVTNKPQEVQLQMYLLDFIMKLGQMQNSSVT